MDFYIHDNKITIDELVYDFVYSKIDKEEFLKQYEYHRSLERKYIFCREIGLESLDWKELEKRGKLCKIDYTTFNLQKYGMTPEIGETIFNQWFESNKSIKADC